MNHPTKKKEKTITERLLFYNWSNQNIIAKTNSMESEKITTNPLAKKKKDHDTIIIQKVSAQINSSIIL